MFFFYHVFQEFFFSIRLIKIHGFSKGLSVMNKEIT